MPSMMHRERIDRSAGQTTPLAQQWNCRPRPVSTANGRQTVKLTLPAARRTHCAPVF